LRGQTEKNRKTRGPQHFIECKTAAAPSSQILTNNKAAAAPLGRPAAWTSLLLRYYEYSNLGRDVITATLRRKKRHDLQFAKLPR
jgi:hypothetical protein